MPDLEATGGPGPEGPNPGDGEAIRGADAEGGGATAGAAEAAPDPATGVADRLPAVAEDDDAVEDIDAVPGADTPDPAAPEASDAAAAAAAEGEADPEPAAAAEQDDEPDPLQLVEGQVPLYNPNPFPVLAPWNGNVYTVRAQGVDLVPTGCANLAVGPDNVGGRLSKTGLRRLYGPEPRLAVAAVSAGLTLAAFAEQRNSAIVAEADRVAASHNLASEIGGE